VIVFRRQTGEWSVRIEEPVEEPETGQNWYPAGGTLTRTKPAPPPSRRSS